MRYIFKGQSIFNFNFSLSRNVVCLCFTSVNICLFLKSIIGNSLRHKQDLRSYTHSCSKGIQIKRLFCYFHCLFFEKGSVCVTQTGFQLFVLPPQLRTQVCAVKPGSILFYSLKFKGLRIFLKSYVNVFFLEQVLSFNGIKYLIILQIYRHYQYTNK